MEMDKLAIHGGMPVRTEAFPSWPVIGEEEERLVLEVVRSGQWGGSGIRNKLPELEEKFAALHDAKHAVTLVNGTMGLTVALQAVGVIPGDEVIMPPYTFIATATSALLFGAIPVFVDVDPDSLNLDPDKVEAAITSRTKAIVAVHIAGAPANMTRLKVIADKHGLKLIEDAAQGVGASWEGGKVGALGDLGSFSFQLGKNVTSGEGGIVLTNDEEIADRVWSLANVGRVRKGAWYQHERIGWNLRMTELQAALLLGQLSRFAGQFEWRERNAKLLDSLLGSIDGIRLLQTDPRITGHGRHMYMFALDSMLADRIGKTEFIRMLQAEGIPAQPGYVSLNRNKAVIADIAKWNGVERIYDCPVSERYCDKEVVWLMQNVLLAGERDMSDIAESVMKIINAIR